MKRVYASLRRHSPTFAQAGPIVQSPRVLLCSRPAESCCLPRRSRMATSHVKDRTWPGSTLTRVPYWVYQDDDNYRAELRRIFEGPAWNYVCLESEIARPGDYRTTFVGEMPVIVVRSADGGIRAFENRCAHRGALIALDDAGSAKHFQCVYHAWTYDLEGNLVGIAFEKGTHGRGGMPADFCKAEHAPRKLRTTTLCGLVFATLTDDTPTIEEYLGEDVRGRIARVLRRPVQVLGRFTQALPNNWKDRKSVV